MKKLIERLTKKREVKKNRRLKNNNKGFSLVELLIVIAIMGVLAVLAFNMFGGVLANSKKKADSQQALNIQKAILTYCVDTNDWDLSDLGITAASDPEDVIAGLMDGVSDGAGGYKVAPLLNKRDDSKSGSDPDNIEAYKPQWATDKGGEYHGWNITINSKTQNVVVKPASTAADVKLTITT